jgi:PI31 proteasome regulator N-terminal
MSSNFGIDLIFETQRGNIRSENDVLMIIVHWILCKKEFRCVGIGDNVNSQLNYLTLLDLQFFELYFRKYSAMKIVRQNFCRKVSVAD